MLDRTPLPKYYFDADFNNLSVILGNTNTYEKRYLISFHGTPETLISIYKYLGTKPIQINARGNDSFKISLQPGEIWAACSYSGRLAPEVDTQLSYQSMPDEWPKNDCVEMDLTGSAQLKATQLYDGSFSISYERRFLLKTGGTHSSYARTITIEERFKDGEFDATNKKLTKRYLDLSQMIFKLSCNQY